MKVTRRQLRRIIREAHASPAMSVSHNASGVIAPADHYSPDVPVPEEYDAVRDLMTSNPDAVNMGVSTVMDMAGTSCQRSSIQAIVDHLQGLLDT